MEISYRIDKDILYISVEGRVDASNASSAEEKIFNIKNEFKNKSKTILNNRIDEALFFVSLIFNNFYFDKNTNFEKVFNTGVLIPKRIIEEILPVRPYFEIKTILEKAEIISEVQVLGNDFSFTYSKKLLTGYVMKKYVDIVVPTTVYQGKVTANVLNVRKSNSTSAAVVTEGKKKVQLKKNEEQHNI